MGLACMPLRRLVLAMLLLAVRPIFADPFEQGSRSVSVILGSGQAFNTNYTIAGAGLGYYVLDGLELGFEAQRWFGGAPAITKLSPRIQYVYDTRQTLKPYVGALFRRTFIDGLEQQDAAGVRAGVFFSSRSNYYLSAGLVYERYLDCDNTVFLSCSDSYPEVSFSIHL